jgi:uridylate kinase
MVLLAGGTGSPFFTTDTCAAQRACELGADVLLKATKVDGVFDRDPMADPAAKRYDTLTYQKVLADRLGVMDLTAISLCMQAGIPIVVFKLADAGNLASVVAGKKIGTIVTS